MIDRHTVTPCQLAVMSITHKLFNKLMEHTDDFRRV